MTSEVREVAEAAARRAVQELFLTLGADISDPDSILQVQADFRHLRSVREASEAVRRYSLKAAITMLVTTFVGYLLVTFGWQAIK